MFIENKKVNDPIKSTFNDLKLFEQDNYCYAYLKNNNPDMDDSKLLYNSKIASSAFRQANEYYNSALNASINTSPLLYSYAMNNLLKGVCYLKSLDEEILNGFNAHGFEVKHNQLEEDALNSKVTFMKRKGAIHSLLKLYGDSLNAPQEIKLYKLLRHIPNIEKFYYESIGSISFIASRAKHDNDEFIFYGLTIDDESKNIMDAFPMIVGPIPQQEICIGYITVKAESLIRDKIFSQNDLFYRDYINLPEEFADGVKSINVSFYCYLLIMAYGMIVRYDAHIWEKYIDKKCSKYSTLIELSISNAVLNFYFQMHHLLFGFYYDEDSYTEIDIKKIINDSTADIMNNITKKIKNDNFVNNGHCYLPWKENVR